MTDDAIPFIQPASGDIAYALSVYAPVFNLTHTAFKYDFDGWRVIATFHMNGVHLQRW